MGTTDLPDAEAGQKFDITMDLVAPNEEGEYEGCWNITLVDSNSNDLSNIPPQMTLWVKIVVQETQEVPDDSSWSVIEESYDSDGSESEMDESKNEEENIQENENEDNQQSNDVRRRRMRVIGQKYQIAASNFVMVKKNPWITRNNFHQ